MQNNINFSCSFHHRHHCYHNNNNNKNSEFQRRKMDFDVNRWIIWHLVYFLFEQTNENIHTCMHKIICNVWVYADKCRLNQCEINRCETITRTFSSLMVDGGGGGDDDDNDNEGKQQQQQQTTTIVCGRYSHVYAGSVRVFDFKPRLMNFRVTVWHCVWSWSCRYHVKIKFSHRLWLA